MSKRFGDILKASRLSAGLKRDPAAEELHIAVRTLDSYESTSEDNEPDMDMIRQMCILYKDPDLARKYLKRSAIGEFFPDITEMYGTETFQSSTLKVLDKIANVNDNINQIIHIASDGRVNPWEVQDWGAIQSKLKDLVNAVTVLISVNK